MCRLLRAIGLLAGIGFPVGGAAAEPSEALALQQTFQRIIERSEPAVACVLVSRSNDYGQFDAAPPDAAAGKLGRFDCRHHIDRQPFQQGNKARSDLARSLDLSRLDHAPEAFGSGVVIDESGLVLTCAHVIRRATKIYVRLPGERGSYADIHAADPRSDLAVLRLLDPPAGLKAIKLGDGEKLRKGQWVVSLSNPYGAGFRDGSPSASVGIVSNLRRPGAAVRSEYEAARQPLHAFGTLIQTDVRINLGCSGGALLNLDGELIGVSTALAASTGGETPGGFGLPLDTAGRRIVEVLRRGGEVEYGFLGVSMDRDPLPHEAVRLAGVVQGGPAEAAGLQKDDYVVAIDGRPVRDHDDLLLLVATGLAGTDVRVEVRRGSPRGEKVTVTATLVKAPLAGAVMAANRPPPRAGLRVDHASIMARENGAIPVGVAIRDVVPRGAADRARLQPGKIITHVDGKAVTSPQGFYRALDGAGAKVKITVLDLGGQQAETLTLDKE
jgi:serine protease Do